MDTTTLDQFTLAYIDCALWASTDEDGDPLDQYTIDDLAHEALAKILEDCASFQAEVGELLGDQLERAGHDFF